MKTLSPRWAFFTSTVEPITKLVDITYPVVLTKIGARREHLIF